MRSFLLALTLSALLLAGCGGDDGDTASSDTTAPVETTLPTDDTIVDETGTEDICAQLTDLTDIDPAELPTQADIDQLTAVAETAPPEIQAAVITLADIGQLIADTGEAALNDPDAFAEIEAATTSPEVTAAGETLVVYSADECDLEVPLFTSFTQ